MSEHHGFASNFWATKKQWEKMGCELSVDAKPAAVFHHFTVKAKEGAEQLAEDEVTSGFGRKVLYHPLLSVYSSQVRGGDNQTLSLLLILTLPWVTVRQTLP